MSHKDLMEQSKLFLSRSLHVNPSQFVEDSDIQLARIEEAMAVIDKLTGHNPVPATPQGISPTVNAELNKFAQGRPTPENTTDLYSGKSANGSMFFITQDKNGFTIQKQGNANARIPVNTYGTFETALYMLQSQVPSIVAIENKMQVVQDVSKEAVTPTDVYSFDDLHESCDWTSTYKKYSNDKGATNALKQFHASGWEPTKAVEEIERRGITGSIQMNEAVSHILNEIGVADLSMISEEKRQELIEIASEVYPFLKD